MNMMEDLNLKLNFNDCTSMYSQQHIKICDFDRNSPLVQRTSSA